MLATGQGKLGNQGKVMNFEKNLANVAVNFYKRL